MVDPNLASKMILELAAIGDHLHEMRTRRDYTDAEMLGHFCTELRRKPTCAPFAELVLWAAPFKPSSSWFSTKRTAYYEGTPHTLERADMADLCERASTLTKDDRELATKIAELEAKLPTISLKTNEMERLTRQTTLLLQEAKTFAEQNAYE